MVKLSRSSLDTALANMFSSPVYQHSYVFYGHIIAQCTIVVEDMDSPAAVSFHLDHYRLHINPLLFDKYPLEQQLFILQHECHHILNGHVARREDRNHKAFNYATDCAINQLADPKHVPAGCIMPTNFPSKHKVPNMLSAEQYYDLLDFDQIEEDSECSTGTGGGHDKWDESEGYAELQSEITKNLIERAITQTQKSRGSIPSNIGQLLELHSRQSELDWKKVLRRIVGNRKVSKRKTILRQDRRMPDMEHIKGTTKERTFELLVVSDVSGSVCDKALVSLWEEVRYICSITKIPVSLIQVDSEAHQPGYLKATTKSISRVASGGTYLSPAIQMAKDSGISYDAVVVTTDGCLSEEDVMHFASLRKPVVWLIEANGEIMPGMSAGRMQAFKLKG